MNRDDAQKKIQELLAEVKSILDVCGDIAMQSAAETGEAVDIVYSPVRNESGMQALFLRVGAMIWKPLAEQNCNQCNGKKKIRVRTSGFATPSVRLTNKNSEMRQCYYCNGTGKTFIIDYSQKQFYKAAGGPRWWPANWQSSSITKSNEYNEWLFGDEYRLWDSC